MSGDWAVLDEVDGEMGLGRISLEDVLQVIDSTGFEGMIWLLLDTPNSGRWLIDLNAKYTTKRKGFVDEDDPIKCVRQFLAYSSCSESENVTWTQYSNIFSGERKKDGLWIKDVSSLVAAYSSAPGARTYIMYADGDTTTVPPGVNYWSTTTKVESYTPKPIREED